MKEYLIFNSDRTHIDSMNINILGGRMHIYKFWEIFPN